MAKVDSNGIRIEYETFGETGSPTLLLIIGLGGQLIDWDEGLCRELAQSGLYVIRFDNRDAGLSTKLEPAGIPDIMGIIQSMVKGEKVDPPYTIEEMAADAVGLLDALGIDKAHICGMSMGGMIAQTIALNYPQRVLSLISIYSKSGDPREPPPTPEATQLLMAPPPTGRDATIEFTMNLLNRISGKGFAYDQRWLREHVERGYERSYYPQGAARQLAAVFTQKNRIPALKSLSVPALVVHGSDDPLVNVECGRKIAAAIPDARLMIIEGMGHDLPHGGAWSQIVDAIIELTQKVRRSV